MNRHYVLSAAIAAITVAVSAPCFAESRLDKAAQEVQVQTGGTLVSIRPHAHGAQFEAVLVDQNGTLQTALYNTARAQIESTGPSTGKEAPRHAKAISGAQISLNDALQKAENISGEDARSARFVASHNGDLLAYRVMTRTESGQARTLFIDAKSGEELPATRFTTD